VPYGSRDSKRFERAHPLGHVPTVQNEMVKQRLKRYQSPGRAAGDLEHAKLIRSLQTPVDKLPGADRDVRWLVTVDGSQHEEEIDERFPSTRLLFTQIAGVLVDLHRLRETKDGFVDPAVIADAQRGQVFAGFLPSSNLPSLDEDDPHRAFRNELFTLMDKADVEGINLLDVLVALEQLRGDADGDEDAGSSQTGGKFTKCPTCERAYEPKTIARNGSPCPNTLCDETLLPTDALRIHEAFDPWGSNGEVGTRVMLVLEHLTLACLARTIQKRSPSALDDLAFIADGPLALFGGPARMRRTLLKFWQRLSAKVIQQRGHPPLILGVEKNGEFVEHAHDLGELLEPGHLMRLPVDYIKRYISFQNSQYGEGTYFGRKFIYRTSDERTIVFTVPPLGRDNALPYAVEEPPLGDYPTLGPTCHLLDVIGTRLHDNAVIPVALAHQWAAYPLRTAGTVLRLHAHEHLAAEGTDPGTPAAVLSRPADG
jgi:hypothetical protein